MKDTRILLSRDLKVWFWVQDSELAKEMQEMFASPYMRINYTSDVIGVEICGALKNVLAIAAGIVEGLDLGHNAMAALVTQVCSSLLHSLLAFFCWVSNLSLVQTLQLLISSVSSNLLPFPLIQAWRAWSWRNMRFSLSRCIVLSLDAQQMPITDFLNELDIHALNALQTMIHDDLCRAVRKSDGLQRRWVPSQPLLLGLVASVTSCSHAMEASLGTGRKSLHLAKIPHYLWSWCDAILWFANNWQ